MREVLLTPRGGPGPRPARGGGGRRAGGQAGGREGKEKGRAAPWRCGVAEARCSSRPDPTRLASARLGSAGWCAWGPRLGRRRRRRRRRQQQQRQRSLSGGTKGCGRTGRSRPGLAAGLVAGGLAAAPAKRRAGRGASSAPAGRDLPPFLPPHSGRGGCSPPGWALPRCPVVPPPPPSGEPRRALPPPPGRQRP